MLLTLFYLESWNCLRLLLVRYFLYLLHISSWWEPLANVAGVILPGGLQLSRIVFFVCFFYLFIFFFACLFFVCLFVCFFLWVFLFLFRCLLYLLHRSSWWEPLASGRDVDFSGGLEQGCFVTCRCLPVPAAHAQLFVGRGMRFSGLCWSMDGAWPAPGSGVHPDLLTASTKSNFEPL